MKRSVAGIAIENNAVFIARRKAGGSLGGKWEFPGGKAEEGESDEAALRREYIEEFGAVITVGPLLASAEFTHNDQQFLLNAYRIFFEKRDFCLTEHEEWRWAVIGEISLLDFADSDLKLLPPLQMYLKEQAGIHNR
ncbi:MAG: (deoxy)nucleoside triphosphate pyrophosphohydrolase [Treponema sp.]|nr:(deoxy)nucleoside triphosphate pyrophosphohydrolase [Treponema sp.]